jgi:hypothetical protein
MQQRLIFAPIFDLFCVIIFMSGVFVFVFHNMKIASLFFCWGVMQQRRVRTMILTFPFLCIIMLGKILHGDLYVIT